MKRFLILIVVGLVMAATGVAQPVATEGRVEYQKGQKSAAMIELPYSPDVIANAIREEMLKKGIKEEKIKGFQVFRGAMLNPADSQLVDLYFKVDRKSRKENASLVYLLVGRPNENVALRITEDMYRVNDGKAYLAQLIPTVEAQNLEAGISEQDNVIKKADKRLRELEKDQQDLEKKIGDLQEKLEQNRRDQDAQAAELNKQRSAKDAMQSRRSAN